MQVGASKCMGRVGGALQVSHGSASGMLLQRLVCSQEIGSMHNLQSLVCGSDVAGEPFIVQRLYQSLIHVQRDGHDEPPEDVRLKQVAGHHIPSQDATMATWHSRATCTAQQRCVRNMLTKSGRLCESQQVVKKHGSCMPDRHSIMPWGLNFDGAVPLSLRPHRCLRVAIPDMQQVSSGTGCCTLRCCNSQ